MSATDFRDVLQSRVPYIALLVLGATLFAYFLYEDYVHGRVKTAYQATPCEIVSTISSIRPQRSILPCSIIATEVQKSASSLKI